MFNSISQEKEIELIKAAQESGNFDDVFDYLDPLVKSMVSKYVDNDSGFEEVYNKIPIPLERIIDKYRGEERDYKFSTYFTGWVKEILEKKD